MRRFYSCFMWMLAAFASAGLCVSCDDDSNKADPSPDPTPAEKLSGVYSNKIYPERELVLQYQGEPLSGRDIEFSTTDLQTGTLVLKNIVPGEKEVTISNVALKPKDKTKPIQYRFGSQTTDVTTGNGVKFTFNDASYVADNHMSFALANVTFPDNMLNKNSEGTSYWGLKPFNSQTWGGSLYFKWRVTPGSHSLLNPETGETETVVISESEADNPGGMVSLLPMIMNQLLPQFLREIDFLNTGIVRASYNSGGLGGTPAWTLSPNSNLCHFYVRDSKLFVVPNIEQIYDQVKANQTKALDIDYDDIAQLYKLLSSWINDGIPFGIKDNGDGSVLIYLATDQLTPLLKLLPLVTGIIPEDMQALVGSLLNTMVMYAPITETFELGLNIVPLSSPMN